MKRLPMVLVTVVMTLAACGGTSTASTASGGPGKVDSIASEVPDSIKSLAPLQIATDATYAPNEFINPDTGEIEGWDIDLGKAICKGPRRSSTGRSPSSRSSSTRPTRTWPSSRPTRRC